MTLDDLICALTEKREQLGRGDVAVIAKQADGETRMRAVLGVDDTFAADAVIVFSAD